MRRSKPAQDSVENVRVADPEIDSYPMVLSSNSERTYTARTDTLRLQASLGGHYHQYPAQNELRMKFHLTLPCHPRQTDVPNWGSFDIYVQLLLDTARHFCKLSTQWSVARQGQAGLLAAGVDGEEICDF
jgi:hypothetical protein